MSTFDVAQHPLPECASVALPVATSGSYNELTYEDISSFLELCDEMATQSLVASHDFARENSLSEQVRGITRKANVVKYDHNPLLREYSTQRGNMVLDSVNPVVAPHLVVTPSDNTLSALLVYWAHRIGPQSSTNLIIPRLPNYHYRCSASVNLTGIPRRRLDVRSIRYHGHRPGTVFSHSLFGRTLSRASPAQAISPILATAIQRIGCKANAFAAADRNAHFYQLRRKSSTYCSQFEKPFEWADPGVPIMQMNLHPGSPSIFIDSVCPFVAPHVMITRPTPCDDHDPWTVDAHLPPYFQDHGWGSLLVVPPALYYARHEINFAVAVTDEEGGESVWTLYEEYGEAGGSGSESETLSPQTPSYSSDQRRELTVDVDEEDSRWALVVDGCEAPDALLAVGKPSGTSGSYNTTVWSSFEEDEDLPPWDDFYVR